MTDKLEVLKASARGIARLLGDIASFDSWDIDGDIVDIRFEDENGRDTGADVSITETADKASQAIGELLAALEEKDARAAACVAAFEGIETERIAGKNLGEFLAGEVRLNKAEPKPDGSFGFTFSGFAVQIMAEAFADQFKSSGAVNYLELLFEHKEIGPLTVTMQRVEGLTPSQKLAAAEQREEHLKASVDVLSAKNAELEREKTNIAMLCADTCAKAKQKNDELEQRLQQPNKEGKELFAEISSECVVDNDNFVGYLVKDESMGNLERLLTGSLSLPIKLTLPTTRYWHGPLGTYEKSDVIACINAAAKSSNVIIKVEGE